MNTTIKAICTDIDGTLLNADRGLSTETVAAFAKANLPTILSSSRPPQAMRYLQKELGILGSPLIAYNGGLILGKEGAVLQNNSLRTELLSSVIEHHKNHNYNLSIYSHEHWFTDQEDTWTAREIRNTRSQPAYQNAAESLNLLNKQSLGIHKLMCMGSPDELDDLISHLNPDYRNKVHLYRSKDTYIEMTPKHIDKAKALQYLLSTQYPFGMEAVLAFGDNHNDDELIKQAGVGVAVGNATDHLKSLADFVSPHTNKEGAVARMIEAFLLSDRP